MEKEEARKRLKDARRSLIALARRGHATSAEVLTATFGTEHPNGLDVEAYPNEKIIFLDSWHPAAKDTYVRFASGTASGNISTLSFLMLGYTFGTITHEHAHNLQHAAPYYGYYSAKAQSLISSMKAETPVRDTVGYKIKSFIYRHSLFFKTHDESMEDYLSSEHEIQARLHTELTRGYARWDRMPGNEYELWAALKDCGYKTPPLVDKLLATEKGQRACALFNTPWNQKSIFDEEKYDLNRVFNFMALPKSQEKLWTHVYPMLYANLLEMYGDRGAQSRMSMPQVRTPFYGLLNQLEKDRPVTKLGIDFGLERVQPEDMPQLLATIFRGRAQGRISPQNARTFFEAAGKRPDLRDAMLNEQIEEIDPYMPMAAHNVMSAAILYGMDEIVDCALNFGYAADRRMPEICAGALWGKAGRYTPAAFARNLRDNCQKLLNANDQRYEGYPARVDKTLALICLHPVGGFNYKLDPIGMQRPISPEGFVL